MNATLANGNGAASDPDSGNAAEVEDQLAVMAVEHLIVGRKLQFPVYDNDNVLLLAEGSTITEEFKQYLANRQVTSVQMHAADVENVTLQLTVDDVNEFAEFDDEMTNKLDQVIESGMLFAGNTGSALRKKVVSHGTEGYDKKKQNATIERHKRNAKMLDSMMSEVLHGRNADADAVSKMASKYVQDMTEDLDGVLATVFTAKGENDIADHCVKMSLLAMAIGIEMGLDGDNVRCIGITGLVHDWGMARISKEIRLAPRILTDAEFFEIKKHPIYSLELLERCRGVPPQVPLVSYQVHERPNGTGYPRGRTSEFIHLFARILNVADTYRALIAPRPFRPALKPYAANLCLLRQANAGDVDPKVLRALLQVISLYPIGSFVVLSDSSVARVLRRNGDDYARPIVQIVQDPEGNRVPPSSESGILNLGETDLDITQTLPTPGSDEIGLTDVIAEMPRFRQGGAPDRPPWLSSGPLSNLQSRISLETYNMKQLRAAHRAMDLADRCAQRTDWRYDGIRRFERVGVRTSVAICLSPDVNAAKAAGRVDTFRALARDVSQGGVSFIHPEVLTDTKILIGLEVPENGRQWFQAEVVRRREIEAEGFWEYGVAFRRRVGGD